LHPRRQISSLIGLFLLLAFLPGKLLAQMEFIENKGQWDERIKYKAEFSTGTFHLEKDGYSVLLHEPSDLDKFFTYTHGHVVGNTPLPDSFTLHSFFYRVSFLGAGRNMKSVPEKLLPQFNNYFNGTDKSKWAADCKIFQAVTYKEVYPNIDVRYYMEGERLKYDFIVHPGGNVSQIALRFDGPEEMKISEKQLILKTAVGEVKELAPFSFQPSATGARDELDCKYVLKNNILTFQVKRYDPTKTLVIDPTIIFASFTGSTADNWGYTATPGPDGSFFAGGIVFKGLPGETYLTSPGAFQTTFQGGETDGTITGGYDIAIFKFSSNGSARLYATYLGGSGNEQPHSMITDSKGNLIVAGRTTSNNYPVTRPLIGSGGNADIFITKFNATGTALLGSVKIGGSGNDGVNIRSKYVEPQGAESLRRNYGDDARSEVILDGAGNIILASCSSSPDFPTLGTPLNITGGYGGGTQDGVILKFNSTLSSYQYGSFFGGSGTDACFVASINPANGNLFVAGGTTSNNLPGTTATSLYPNFKGGETDGFITSLKIDGSGLIKSSYLGTAGIDMVYGLKFDRIGFPYVMGTTTGSWPIINAAFSNPGSSQFIAKLKPDLSGFVYSTIFGTGSQVPNLSPIGFLVDRCENVYFTGWGGGVNNAQNYNTGNTRNLPEINPIPGIPAADGQDFFFFVLRRDAQAQLFGTHFGQFGGYGDHVDGGTSRFDENGIIYQAICGNCGRGVSFPTTPGVWRSTNGSRICNQIALKVEMNFAGVSAGVQASINAVINDTLGCIPFRVDFSDTLRKGKTMYWDFGNGQRDTSFAPDFSTFTIYNAVGNYRVRVIAEDSASCNIRDTSYVIIKAGNNEANLDFRAVKDTPCTSLNYTFFNQSVPDFGSFGPQSFEWDFGDGSPPVISFNATHTFPAVGDYVVKLKLIDTLFCNSPAEKVLNLRVNPLIKATFTTPALGCAPYLAQFTNTSGTADVTWEFDDGTTSIVENPVKSYPVPGTYRVRLIARDPNTCNKIDTSDYFSILVSPRPDARFTWAPNPPLRNTPTNFTNQTLGAVRYLWNFGDGGSSTEENPSYQYNATGSYRAELIAFNAQNCTDTFTLTVRALVDPLLDVPNAFTPGRFGQNGIIKVAGFGIGKMDWKIYNRWGQLIFQSTNKQQGWDGTFKGKLQAMDVYVYTLDVEFTDGKKLRKTGDITLLR